MYNLILLLKISSYVDKNKELNLYTSKLYMFYITMSTIESCVMSTLIFVKLNNVENRTLHYKYKSIMQIRNQTI